MEKMMSMMKKLDKKSRKSNKKEVRKRVILAMLACALIAVTAIGGVLAYFTDAESTVNTFTVGKISLELREPGWNPEEGENLIPGQTVRKDPQIFNDGVNDEYVFMTVTIPYAYVETANADGSRKAAADTELFGYTANVGWTQLARTVNQEAKTVEYLYVWGTQDQCTALTKGSLTAALFDEVTFANVIEDQGIEETVQNIVVCAYGIQTENVNGGSSNPNEIWKVIKNQQPTLDE